MNLRPCQSKATPEPICSFGRQIANDLKDTASVSAVFWIPSISEGGIFITVTPVLGDAASFISLSRSARDPISLGPPALAERPSE